jgi:acyl-CoA synthetase (AMP-forming)/AMP-acid ligase II
MTSMPWLAHYGTDVPPTLAPCPDRTLLDLVADTAHERPDHPFPWFKGRGLSHAEVDRLTGAFAAVLIAEGVAPNDRVGALLPDCPPHLIAPDGVRAAGWSLPAGEVNACRRRWVGADMVPKHDESQDPLPTSIIGKPLRRVLRDKAGTAGALAPAPTAGVAR